MYKIRKYSIECSKCGRKLNFENIGLEGNYLLVCKCGEKLLDLDGIRGDVLQAIIKLNPNDLQSWAGIEQDGESIDPETLRELGNIQGWDVYLDAYGKPWLFRDNDSEEPGNVWMLPIYRYISKEV